MSPTIQRLRGPRLGHDGSELQEAAQGGFVEAGLVIVEPEGRLPLLAGEAAVGGEEAALPSNDIAGKAAKELQARLCRAYGISFLEDKIIVTMSGPSKGGWLVYDPRKTREFPPDTPLEEVVRVIWEDIRSTPELWEEDAP